MRDIVGEFGESETYFAEAPFPEDQSYGNERFKAQPDAKRTGPDAKKANPDDPGLIFDDEAWDEKDIPKRPWIAPGYLLRNSVTILAGVPGGGKSSLAVSWATSLATGEAFGAFTPAGSLKVLTYNTEDDRDEQRRRFSASLRHFGRSPADLNGKVVRVGIERIGTLFGERGSDENGNPLGFGALPAMEALKKRIEDFKPDVIILDPLVELHDKDENSNTELRRVVAEFRTLAIEAKAAVVLLHHTRKGSALAAGDADSIRGGGSIVGAGRIALTITKMSEDDAQNFGIPDQDRQYYLRLDEAKANYSLTPVDWFEKNVHMLDNQEGVMALAPWEPPADVVSLETGAQIEAEIAIGSSAGPWSPKMSGDARSVRTLFTAHGIKTAKGQGALLKSLYAAGFSAQDYRRTNGAKAQGIRAPSKAPNTVNWVGDTASQ